LKGGKNPELSRRHVNHATGTRGSAVNALEFTQQEEEEDFA